MAAYDYAINNADVGRLADEVLAAGLPLDTARGVVGTLTAVTVYTTRDLTPAEKTTLDGVVAAHDGRPRRPRALYAIFNDLSALSAGNKLSVWGDLSGGTPKKYLLDRGANAGAISAHHSLLTNAALAGAALSSAQMLLATCYVQDNPRYLVAPAFAPALNVPGDEPIP